MFNSRLLFGFAFAAFLIAGNASASPASTVLFDNFDLNNTVPTSVNCGGTCFGGWSIQGYGLDPKPPGWTGSWTSVGGYVAVEFEPNVSAILTQIDVAISGIGGDNDITLEIFSNNNGAPGTQITDNSWSFVAPNSQAVTTVNTLGITLSANTEYWLVAIPEHPDSQAIWYNDEYTEGPYALGTGPTVNSSYWQQYTTQGEDGSQPYLALIGNTVSPEPGTLGTFAAAGLALLLFGSLRRKFQRILSKA